jgi:iron complex outermembrane receptor protein
MEITNPLGFSSQSAVAGLTCSNPDALQCNAAPPINFGPGIGNVFVSTISRPYQKMWFRNHGLYAQATYNFTDQLALTGGFRYTWDRQTHRYDATAIGFPAANTPVYFCSNTARVRNADGTFPVFLAPNEHDRCNVTFTAKSDKPTWLINLDYKPNSDILLYAKWARGYRAAGVNSANIFFESWGPEKVDTYEAGAKTSFRGSWARGYFNIAGFYNDFRDQQIQHSLIRAPTSPLLGGFAIINAGKSRIWGIEVDSAVTFFDSLRIEAGYTYLNTKILKLDPVVLTPEEQLFWLRVPPNSAENGQLGLSPENRVTVTGTYTLPLDKSIGDISLGATFIHTDSQIALSPQATPFYRLPASDLLNLNASWNNVLGKPIDLSFFMTNTTNAKFPVSVVNAWGSYGFEGVLVNEPRMWGFRLKYHFGGE